MFTSYGICILNIIYHLLTSRSALIRIWEDEPAFSIRGKRDETLRLKRNQKDVLDVMGQTGLILQAMMNEKMRTPSIPSHPFTFTPQTTHLLATRLPTFNTHTMLSLLHSIPIGLIAHVLHNQSYCSPLLP